MESIDWNGSLDQSALLFLGHNMSQTDANSMGGESSRGGHVGHTGTGCYKNHEHSMLHGQPALAPTPANRSGRRPSAVATATGAVSIAAVTALLASSPATNVSGHPANVQHHQPNNLVDLGIILAGPQIRGPLIPIFFDYLQLILQAIRRVPGRDCCLSVTNNMEKSAIRLVRHCPDGQTVAEVESVEVVRL